MSIVCTLGLNVKNLTKLENTKIELNFTVSSSIRRTDVLFANQPNFQAMYCNQPCCAQWAATMVQFADEDSNLIGYSGLSNIMADSVRLCSLFIYIY